MEVISKPAEAKPLASAYCDFTGLATNNSELVEIVVTIPPRSSFTEFLYALARAWAKILGWNEAVHSNRAQASKISLRKWVLR